MRESSYAPYVCCYGMGSGKGDVGRRKLADLFEL